MRFLASILAVCLFVSTSEARIIFNYGSSPNPFIGVNSDIVCFGGRIAGNTIKNDTEVCIDANGDLVPTANAINLALPAGITDNQSLGTAATPWGTAYFGTQVFISGITPGAAIGTSPYIVGLQNPGYATSTCGNSVPQSPTLETGTDFAGIITLGTGGAAASACTLAFNPVYLNTPICSVTLVTSANGAGSNIALNPIILPTSIQFTTGLGFPGHIDYICVGQTQ